MAFTGWSSSNYILLGSGVVAAAPLTMACWARTPSLGNQTLMGLHNSGSAINRNTFRMFLLATSAGALNGATSDASASALAETIAPAVDTWFHAAMVVSSASSRSIFLNGANKVTETTSRTPTGIDRTSVGAAVASVVSNPVDAAGSVAEAAIWDVALSDDEIASLAKGLSPLVVRPQSLRAYLPLVRDLVDARGNAFAVTGSLAAADHTRTYAPF
jgi:hypothetical protein